MKRIRTLTLLLAAVLTAGVVAVGCGGEEKEKWEGKEIPLGALFSTTGDGSTYGPQQVNGAQLAVDEINADGGVEGASVTLTQRDDESTPEVAADEMRELIEQAEVLAVLGPTFSNAAAEADPVANELGTPVIAVSNTGPGIVGDCDYPCDFIFRDSLGEATAIPANVDHAVSAVNPKVAAVIHPANDPFGETSAETARQAFEKAGVKVTVHTADEFFATDPKNPPQIVMITASAGEAAADLIKDLRRSGFKGTILGGNAFNSPVVAEAAGKAGKGAQSASAWYAGNESEENQEFIEAYRAKYGEEPDQFAAQAYTGVKLLAEAAEEADLSFDDVAADRKALKEALEGVHEETPLGDFSFTPDHDVSQPIWIVAMNGKDGYDLVEKVEPK
jgi:branched-chain amino acid transport system substrate-binding protein